MEHTAAQIKPKSLGRFGRDVGEMDMVADRACRSTRAIKHGPLTGVDDRAKYLFPMNLYLCQFHQQSHMAVRMNTERRGSDEGGIMPVA